MDCFHILHVDWYGWKNIWIINKTFSPSFYLFRATGGYICGCGRSTNLVLKWCNKMANVTFVCIFLDLRSKISLFLWIFSKWLLSHFSDYNISLLALLCQVTVELFKILVCICHNFLLKSYKAQWCFFHEKSKITFSYIFHHFRWSTTLFSQYMKWWLLKFKKNSNMDYFMTENYMKDHLSIILFCYISDFWLEITEFMSEILVDWKICLYTN